MSQQLSFASREFSGNSGISRTDTFIVYLFGLCSGATICDTEIILNFKGESGHSIYTLGTKRCSGCDYVGDYHRGESIPQCLKCKIQSVFMVIVKLLHLPGLCFHRLV